MGGFSLWHWLVVLLIVVLLFGTKKLRNLGGDLGSALRSFRKGLSEDESNPQLKAEGKESEAAPKETERQKSE